MLNKYLFYEIGDPKHVEVAQRALNIIKFVLTGRKRTRVVKNGKANNSYKHSIAIFILRDNDSKRR